MLSNKNNMEKNKIKMELFFLPFSKQIEKLILSILGLFFIALLMAQAFILSGENQQALVNKAVQYEGVFHEDPIEAKATLQRR